MDEPLEWVVTVPKDLTDAVLGLIGLESIPHCFGLRSTGRWKAECDDDSVLLRNPENGVSICFYLKSLKLELHNG